MKKVLFGVILGIVLCSGIVYGVNLYKSEDISYEPTDVSWEVNNVSDALNSLYENYSNNVISDLRGKTLIANDISESEDGLNALIKVPEEGHYDGTSIISIPFDKITNKTEGLEILASTTSSGFNSSSKVTTTKDYSYIIVAGAGGNNNEQVDVQITNSAGTKKVLINKVFSTDGYMRFGAAYIKDVPSGSTISITTSYNGARLIIGVV